MKPLFFIASTLLIIAINGCYAPPQEANYINLKNFEAKTSGDRELLKINNPLSLEKAYNIALQNNPTYLATFQAISAARMRYYQALGAYSPSVDLYMEVGDQVNFTSGHNENTSYAIPTVQVSWVLFDGLAREFSMLAAKESQNEQKFLNSEAKRVLLRAVGYTFCDLFYAKMQYDIALGNANFQRFHYQESSKKYTIGEISLSDKLNFLGRLKQSERDLITAKQSYKLAQISLAVLLGYIDGKMLDEQKFTMIEDEFCQYSEQELLDQALTNRPDLEALRSSLKQQEYQLYTQYADYLPTVELFANYSYSHNELVDINNGSSGISNYYEGGNTFNYGVSASLNLFKGFQSHHKVEANKLLLDVAYLRASTQWLNVIEEVKSALLNYNDSIELEQITKETLQIIKEERDLVNKEYRAGVVDIVRLNETQRNYIASSLEYSQALIRKKRAKIELDSAIGADITL